MPKFLDNNGLSHLWTKFKEYLTSWKRTNFGTGTYSNTGTFDIDSYSNIQMGNNRIRIRRYSEFESSAIKHEIDVGWMGTVYTSALANYGIIFKVGSCDSNGSITLESNSEHDLSYLVIGSKGVKSGTLAHSTSTWSYIRNVGDPATPFICVVHLRI